MTESEEIPRLISGRAYLQHGPVVINSSSDFEEQGWPGNGTPSNPYTLEGLNITANGTCINITDTNVFFLVKDCFLPGIKGDKGCGLYLENVTHGRIVNCISNFTRIGYQVENCVDCVLEDNIASQTNQSGIYLSNTSHCLLNNNTVVLTKKNGFSVTDSTACTISNNLASENEKSGFHFHSLSNSTFKNNTATMNFENGFGIYRCLDLYFSMSRAFDNDGDGF
ncbi:MAG: right-handed parallel beta-helix repeat-containing protein, partial [Candidatus Thorarchaeota archaeon]|nr:right-handed parallel beta-helix repeat-containing protein [Candidatus Thorarchaeota archaeon]